MSRWFGGVKLGPDRFRLINNAARALLAANGFGPKLPVTAVKGRDSDAYSPTAATSKFRNK